MNNETINYDTYYHWDRPLRQRATLTMKEQVDIIEDFNSQEFGIDEICKKHSITYDLCIKVISLYFKKPEFGLCIMSSF